MCRTVKSCALICLLLATVSIRACEPTTIVQEPILDRGISVKLMSWDACFVYMNTSKATGKEIGVLFYELGGNIRKLTIHDQDLFRLETLLNSIVENGITMNLHGSSGGTGQSYVQIKIQRGILGIEYHDVIHELKIKQISPLREIIHKIFKYNHIDLNSLKDNEDNS